jgi:hypothetical protein
MQDYPTTEGQAIKTAPSLFDILTETNEKLDAECVRATRIREKLLGVELEGEDCDKASPPESVSGALAYYQLLVNSLAGELARVEEALLG